MSRLVLTAGIDTDPDVEVITGTEPIDPKLANVGERVEGTNLDSSFMYPYEQEFANEVGVIGTSAIGFGVCRSKLSWSLALDIVNKVLFAQGWGATGVRGDTEVNGDGVIGEVGQRGDKGGV